MGALPAYARLESRRRALHIRTPRGNGFLLPISDGDARSVSGIRLKIFAGGSIATKYQQRYTPCHKAGVGEQSVELSLSTVRT